jgi:hypothetical protein
MRVGAGRSSSDLVILKEQVALLQERTGDIECRLGGEGPSP